MIIEQHDPSTKTMYKQKKLPQQEDERLWLTFLDGLRGLTAMYVVVFHVIADGKETLLPETPLTNLLRFGHEAVVVFIVLSGFVLALPLARSSQLIVPGGVRAFFRRRARRILPAYYAALFLSPLYFLLVAFSKQLSGESADWSRIRDMFISTDMLSHLFLVQNLSTAWSGSINPVLWSLSTEWWIYFIFALLLLPIWKRFGISSALCVSVVLGLVPTGMLMLGWPTITGSPHLLGAYGLGMASAALLFEPRFSSQLVTWRKTLGTTAILAFVAFCWTAVDAPRIRLDENTRWITDLLLALVCATFILLGASTSIFKSQFLGLTGVFTQILQSSPLVFLGKISYSLYLTHLVVLAMVGITLGLAPVRRLIILSTDPMPMRILVVIPIQLISAYVFYRLFEKPFLSSHK